MQEHVGHVARHVETAERAASPEPPEKSAVIAVYDTHVEAEQAVRALEKSGFDLKQLSILGKDYQTEEQVVGYYTTGDRMKAWGANGALWGGLWGMLFGSAFFVIPGIGPLLAAGPVVAWIVGALPTAAVVGGLSALGAGLFSIGIPKGSVLEYETQVKAGKFLVIAHSPADKATEAQDTLAATKHEGVKKHSCCA